MVRLDAAWAQAQALLKRGQLDAATDALHEVLSISRFSHEHALSLLTKIYALDPESGRLHTLWRNAACAALEAGREADFLRWAGKLADAAGPFPAELLAAIHLYARAHPLGRRHEHDRAPAAHSPCKIGIALPDLDPHTEASRFSRVLAKHCPPDRFALQFYAARGLENGRSDQHSFISELVERGCQVHVPVAPLTPGEEIPFVVERIHADRPEVLVHQDPARSACWSLIAALRPAPFQAAIHYSRGPVCPGIDLVYTSRSDAARCPVRAVEFVPPCTILPLSGEDTRKRLGVREQEVLLLTIPGPAGQEHLKSWGLLLQVLERHAHVRLLVLSPGRLPDGVRIPDAAAPRVIIHDAATADGVFNAADIYLSTSLPPNARSIAMAMLAGLPVLALGDSPVQLADRNPCFSPADEAAWQRALETLVRDGARRREIGDDNKAYAQRYRPEAAAAWFFQQLAEVLAARAPAAAHAPPAAADEDAASAHEPAPLLPTAAPPARGATRPGPSGAFSLADEALRAHETAPPPGAHPLVSRRSAPAHDEPPAPRRSRIPTKVHKRIDPATLGELCEQRDTLSAALKHLNGNRNREALAAFESVIGREPQNVAARFGCAVALARLGNVRGAKAVLEDLLRGAPEHHLARVLLAQLSDEPSPDDGDPPEAQAALAAVPEAPEAINQLINEAIDALRRNDSPTAARAIAEAAQGGSPVRDLQYVRALCCLAEHQLEQALAALDDELREYPDHAQAAALRAEVQAALIPAGTDEDG